MNTTLVLIILAFALGLSSGFDIGFKVCGRIWERGEEDRRKIREAAEAERRALWERK